LPALLKSRSWPHATPLAQDFIEKIPQAPELRGFRVLDAWTPKIVDILRDPKNKEISVSWGDLSVTPKLLNQAAEAFEQRLVPIIYDSQNKMNIPGVAEYKQQIHIIFFRTLDITQLFEKSTLLHESVHMIQERSGVKHALTLETEIVAHLVQMMYYKLQGGRQIDISARIMPDGSRETLRNPQPLLAAWDLAEFLLGRNQVDGGKHPGDDPKTYHLLVEALRDAIRTSPSYASELAKPLADYTAF
jgi:hypothetical protein